MNSGAASRGFDLAVELLEAGQQAKALPLLHAHLATYPDHAEGHTRLAQAHFGLGDYSSARVAAEQAISLDPGDEFSFRLLAFSWAHLGYRHPAVDAAETAQSIAPNNWATHYVRASIDVLAGTYSARGSAALAPLIELAPDIAASHTTVAGYLLGTRTLLSGDDAAVARSHLTTALSIDPHDSHALYLLGNLESRTLGRAAKSVIPTLYMVEADPLRSVNRRAVLAVATTHVRLLAWIYTALLVVVFISVVEPNLLDYAITAIVTGIIALGCTAAYLLVTVRSLGHHALTLLRVASRVSTVFSIRLIVMAVSLVVLLTGPAVPPSVAEWTTFFSPALLLATGIAAFLDHLREQPTRTR